MPTLRLRNNASSRKSNNGSAPADPRTPKSPGITVVPDGSVTSPKGWLARGVYAGIKTAGDGKLDVGMIASESPATCAAMFTRNTVKGAAVIVSQRHVRNG